MTGEMVERVAKALREAIRNDAFVSYEEAARAAIEAMREPTSFMEKRGDDWCDPHCSSERVWAAMIDAALSDND